MRRVPGEPLSSAAGTVGAGAQDHELVTTDPGKCVARAHDGGQAFGDFGERCVADLMPEGVVDGLEAVEIDEQHAGCLSRFGG